MSATPTPTATTTPSRSARHIRTYTWDHKNTYPTCMAAAQACTTQFVADEMNMWYNQALFPGDPRICMNCLTKYHCVDAVYKWNSCVTAIDYDDTTWCPGTMKLDAASWMNVFNFCFPVVLSMPSVAPSPTAGVVEEFTAAPEWALGPNDDALCMEVFDQWCTGIGVRIPAGVWFAHSNGFKWGEVAAAPMLNNVDWDFPLGLLQARDPNDFSAENFYSDDDDFYLTNGYRRLSELSEMKTALDLEFEMRDKEKEAKFAACGSESDPDYAVKCSDAALLTDAERLHFITVAQVRAVVTRSLKEGSARRQLLRGSTAEEAAPQ